MRLKKFCAVPAGLLASIIAPAVFAASSSLPRPEVTRAAPAFNKSEILAMQRPVSVPSSHAGPRSGGNECDSLRQVYFNGAWDGLNALLAERLADNSLEYWVIDDVTFVSPVVVQDLHWWGNEPVTFNWHNQKADYIIVASSDIDGSPADVLFESLSVAATRVDTGDRVFGDPVWFYTVTGLNISLLPGKYWFGMRPVQDSPVGTGDFDAGWWLTAAPNATDEIYVDYGDTSPWTPGSDDSANGAPWQVAFCLTGILNPSPGACCNRSTGICAENPAVSIQSCLGQGSAAQFLPGPNAHCSAFTPPCGQLVGACCDPATGNCEIASEAQCASLGRAYQGNGTSCLPNPCPPPPVLGACCIDNHNGTFTCRQISQIDCGTAGGTYLGDQTSCAELGPTNRCDCNSNGILDLTDLQPTGGTVRTINVTANAPIPDNDVTGLSQNFNVSTTGTLFDVNIGVNITHTWIGDLTIRIQHGGRTVQLWSQRCADTDDIAAIFDDEGADVNCAVTPIGGNILPAEALSTFDGLSLQGIWTLTVVDNVLDDTGTLNDWSIRALVDATPPRDTDCNTNRIPDHCESPFPCAGVPSADLNCDGRLNGADVAAFTLALVSPSSYASRYPGCNIRNGDINRDGSTNPADTLPFIQCLLNGGCQ